MNEGQQQNTGYVPVYNQNPNNNSQPIQQQKQQQQQQPPAAYVQANYNTNPPVYSYNNNQPQAQQNNQVTYPPVYNYNNQQAIANQYGQQQVVYNMQPAYGNGNGNVANNYNYNNNNSKLSYQQEVRNEIDSDRSCNCCNLQQCCLVAAGIHLFLVIIGMILQPGIGTAIFGVIHIILTFIGIIGIKQYHIGKTRCLIVEYVLEIFYAIISMILAFSIWVIIIGLLFISLYCYFIYKVGQFITILRKVNQRNSVTTTNIMAHNNQSQINQNNQNNNNININYNNSQAPQQYNANVSNTVPQQYSYPQ